VELLRLLLKSIAILAGILLLIGLYKPWVVLWWEDIQNRKKVIKLYGLIALCSFAGYYIVKVILV